MIDIREDVDLFLFKRSSLSENIEKRLEFFLLNTLTIASTGFAIRQSNVCLKLETNSTNITFLNQMFD